MVIRTDGIEIDFGKKTVSHRGHCERFASSLSFALTCHLILGFFNKTELVDLLYGHRYDGGPEMGENQIATMFVQKKHVFKRLHLEFDKIRGGHYYTRYRLVPTSVENE